MDSVQEEGIGLNLLLKIPTGQGGEKDFHNKHTSAGCW